MVAALLGSEAFELGCFWGAAGPPTRTRNHQQLGEGLASPIAWKLETRDNLGLV